MENEFSLPVCYDGKELELPARMLQYGFTVKVEVDIDGTAVVFEPDEERNWRAVMGFEDLVAGKKIKVELLKLIAENLAFLTK